MSLRELSISASNFNDNLGVASENEDFVKICQEYTADATADKVDGYSFVASYKEADIATPQEKKNKLLELVNEIIHRKQRKLELLKAPLLKMHKLGLIDNKLTGKTRTISIQPSRLQIAPLRIEPNAPKIPEEFRDVRVEYRVNSKALVSAWQAEEDVNASAVAEQGHHVRFQHRRVT